MESRWRISIQLSRLEAQPPLAAAAGFGPAAQRQRAVKPRSAAELAQGGLAPPGSEEREVWEYPRCSASAESCPSSRCAGRCVEVAGQRGGDGDSARVMEPRGVRIPEGATLEHREPGRRRERVWRERRSAAARMRRVRAAGAKESVSLLSTLIL